MCVVGFHIFDNLQHFGLFQKLHLVTDTQLIVRLLSEIFLYHTDNVLVNEVTKKHLGNLIFKRVLIEPAIEIDKIHCLLQILCEKNLIDNSLIPQLESQLYTCKGYLDPIVATTMIKSKQMVSDV